MIAQLKEQRFWMHLGFAIVTVSSVALIGFKMLKSFTRHGQAIVVPDFKGKKVSDLNTIFANLPLKYEVVDSIFDPKKPKGTVVEQTPAIGFKVKEDRIIYLTINAFQPPKLKMPNLKDASLRQAESVLLSYGLVLGKKTYKPDYAKDAVLEQRYQGASIKAGTMLPYGAVIDLVLGDGLDDADTLSIPSFVGMNLQQAKRRIEDMELTLGAEVFDEVRKDSLKATVYKQSNTGKTIDLYLTFDKLKINTTPTTDASNE
jgi:eukaryotic-like serine/threonine-protein kinase